jgi:hypothetical protein
MATNTKLHQIIAVEKGIKTRVVRFVTDAYKALQKDALFDGLTRTYEKKDDDGDDFPPERKLVNMRVEDTLQEVAEQLTEYMDIVADKDTANCSARADVMVDGETLLVDVPATHLLFLEKQLTDLNTVLDNLPVLDPAFDWTKDDATGLYKSAPVASSKKAKLAKPIVLYEATEHHPAQTQLIQVDETIGTWTTVKHSGAVTADRKKALQKKARALLKAVKFAREEANSTPVTERVSIGQSVFNYLLG